MTLDEAEQRFERALFHEAGHAAIGLALGCCVTRVRVTAEDAVTTSHHERQDGLPAELLEIQRSAACHLGGYFAERRRFPEERAWTVRCATTDFRRVARLLGLGSSLWRASARLAHRTVAQHWDLIAAIAERVRRNGRVEREELVTVAMEHGIVEQR